MDDVALPPGIQVRPLARGDIPAVVAIETEAFSTPWQAETFEGLLDRDTVELIVMTAGPDQVVGYAVVWCILDQGELANVAIIPERRGQGLGSHLLGSILRSGASRGLTRIYLEVRESNEAAIALYQRFGFEKLGRRQAYYDRPREDALVMAVDL